MKKLIRILLGILTVTSFTHQAFAVDVDSKKDDYYLNSGIINSNLPVQSNLEKNNIIIIKGKEIAIKNSELKVINNYLMIPLESTAENLGFKMTMGKDGVEIKNNKIRSIISIGHDSYFYADNPVSALSTSNISISKPQSLGIAPMILENKIYVPIQFYNVLFNDSNAVGNFKCLTSNNKEIYILNGHIATAYKYNK